MTDNNRTNHLILLVKSGGSGRWRLAAALKGAGFRIVCLNEIKRSWDAVNEWLIDPMMDSQSTIRVVKKYMMENSVKFDACFSYDEYGVILASCIAEELQLPCIPVQLIEEIRNKYNFRKRCQAAGVYVPKFVKLNGAGLNISTEEELQVFF